MPSEADQTIDELLERYLGLVDEYTTLRAALATAQQHMFHALARAHFTADRGARYGPDQYDERMQASRRVVISAAAALPPTFCVAAPAASAPTTEEALDENKDVGEDAKKQPAAAAPTATGDPIRWFGVLVPPALREAQSRAVEAVEDVIPRLASVQAEMAHVEIEVRRARKKRAKASGGEKKQAATNTAQAAVSASS